MQQKTTAAPVYLFIAFGLWLGISGCEINREPDFTISYSYEVQQNKKIVTGSREQNYGADSTYTVTTLSLEEGDNIVFHYQKNVTARPGIVDGGYSRSIYLEIPAGTKQFEFHDTKLRQVNTYFTRGCFCPVIGAIPVTDGFIRGEQISGNLWVIAASLKINPTVATAFRESYEVEFDEIFIQK